MGPKNHRLILLLLLIVSILATYFVVLNGPFLSDDIDIVKKLQSLSDQGSLATFVFQKPYSFVQPLFLTISYLLGGSNPLPYHLINILFHIGTVILVYYLFLLIEKNERIAFFASFLFALHPLVTESVSWITGGTYIMYSFFFLASFLSYIVAARKGFKFYILSCILFFFALATSDKAISLPLIFILYEMLKNDVRKHMLKLSPYFLLSFIYTLTYVFQVKQRLQDVSSLIGTPQVSVIDNRLVKVPIALSSYIFLTLWPQALTLFHSELIYRESLILRIFMCIVFFILLVISFRKNKHIFFWLSFSLVSILVTIAPIGISSTFTERYFYLGLIGFIYIPALLFEKIYQHAKNKMVVYGIFILVVILLGTRTFIRNLDWSDSDRFWLNGLKTSPLSYQVHNNVGAIYFNQGDYDNAAIEFEQVVTLLPNDAKMYQNLGLAYMNLKKYDQSLINYQKAVRLNPNLWLSYWNMGALYFSMGKYDAATENIKKAIKISPSDARLYADLAIVYKAESNSAQARAYFEEALRLDPTNQKAIKGLQELPAL